MTHDRLDHLLTQSIPPQAARGEQLDGALQLMIQDAANIAARRVRPRRRSFVGIAAAASTLLIIGGGGVAVAAGLISWPDGLEEPDSSYTFTLPSGRACEARLLVTALDPLAEPSPDDAVHHPVQEEITRWMGDGELSEKLDLVAAEAEVTRIFAEQKAVGMTVIIGEDGWLIDAAAAPGTPDADDAQAFVVDRAVRSAIQEHLVSAGFPEHTWNFDLAGGVKCAAE